MLAVLGDILGLEPAAAPGSQPEGQPNSAAGSAQPPPAVQVNNSGLSGTSGQQGGNPSYRSSIATEVVAVPDFNRPPLAEDDIYSVTAGSSLIIPAGLGPLQNDNDPDGDSLTAVLDQDWAAPEALLLRGDGSLVFAAEAGREGRATITYRAFDGELLSAPATITILISRQ